MRNAKSEGLANRLQISMSNNAIIPERKSKQKGLVSEFELKNCHLILTPERLKNGMHLGKTSTDILFSFLSQLWYISGNFISLSKVLQKGMDFLSLYVLFSQYMSYEEFALCLSINNMS